MDPMTGLPYEYRVKEGSEYELCATFLVSSEKIKSILASSMWAHPAGRHCFSVDAGQALNDPYIYYPY